MSAQIIRDLSACQLRTILATIHAILWDPPDQEWSPDTLDEIAQVLVSNGIGPRSLDQRRRVA